MLITMLDSYKKNLIELILSANPDEKIFKDISLKAVIIMNEDVFFKPNKFSLYFVKLML